MTLDVILCTFNRSALLRKAVESLFRAHKPPSLEIRLFVVDNNSSDDTAAVVRDLRSEADLPLQYLLERRQGSSFARNTGIAAGRGELVGMIDDDEEIDENWFTVVAREFQDAKVAYIGGCCLPRWQATAPDWLPPGYHAAIGVSPFKPRAWFSSERVGMLSCGNSVIRRAVYDEVGGYSVFLGRTARGLLSEEDADLFRRMRARGLDGLYVPELAIYHHIPAERLTRAYHRRWAFWRSVSQGVLDRISPERVKYLLGVPRYRWGRALRGLFAWPGNLVSRNRKAQAFADELGIWDLLGFFHGRFLFKVPEESRAASSRASA